MSLVGRVVAGTDGSGRSHDAVRWAAARAAAEGLGLTVVRIIPEVPIPTRAGAFRAMRHGPDFQGHVRRTAERHLEDAAAAARSVAVDLDVEVAVRAGDSAGALALLAEEARLLVIGSTGASGVAGVLLGGTAAGVVHHARGPVVVVPGPTPAPEGPIVVGLDDDPAAAGLARIAVDEARLTGRRLVALQAWDVDAALGEMVPLLLKDEGQIRCEADAVLVEVLRAAGGVPEEIERRIEWGRAEKWLVDLSADASLVVVGSRGRGGFAGLLLGSVSRAVIAHGRCPTLVVRAVDTR